MWQILEKDLGRGATKSEFHKEDVVFGGILFTDDAWKVETQLSYVCGEHIYVPCS